MSESGEPPAAKELVGPIIRGDITALEALLARGVSLCTSVSGSFPPLHYAIENGGLAVVRRLVNAGADVNGREAERQRTPLLLAATRGKREAVATLLAAGADVTATDALGWTALDAAATYDGGPAGAIVTMLVEAGCPINQVSTTWGTPLVKAAWKGHPSAVAALLAAGADPNQATPSGCPLMQAIDSKRPAIVAALVAAGADANVRYEWPVTSRFNEAFVGRTPLDVAKANPSMAVLAALTEPPTKSPTRSAATAADVSNLWATLRLTGLAPPATNAEIAALAAVIGRALPDDVVASYRVHNGQRGGTVDGPFALLSTDEVASEWAMWKKSADGGEFRGHQSTPDDGVRSDWWHSGWIPVLSDGGGDALCIDLAPADGGVVGQVIRLYHDAAKRPVIAESWAAYLASRVHPD